LAEARPDYGIAVSPDGWHADLLDEMLLVKNGVRLRVRRR
jgi:hypothetical protein